MVAGDFITYPHGPMPFVIYVVDHVDEGRLWAWAVTATADIDGHFHTIGLGGIDADQFEVVAPPKRMVLLATVKEVAAPYVLCEVDGQEVVVSMNADEHGVFRHRFAQRPSPGP